MKNHTVILGNFPIVVHVPHGGLAFPKNSRVNLAVDLHKEIYTMADLHTPLIFDRIQSILADRGLRAYGFVNNVSRVYVDPERFDDDTEEMNAVGMGVVYSKSSDGHELYTAPLSSSLIATRKNEVYIPHASNFETLVSNILDEYGKVMIIDLHSYSMDALPYELHKTAERPEFCLGVDSFHLTTSTQDKVLTYMKDSVFSYAENAPFSGSYVPLRFYGKDSRVQSLMLEIRKDTYMDEATFTPHEGIEAISLIIANLIEKLGKN